MAEASERLRGNEGLFLTLKKTGVTPAFVADKDVKKAELNPEDKDDGDLTFGEAANGDNKQFKLDLTAIQSLVATSLWRFLWANPGEEFDVVYGPKGNPIPTADKPHYSFKAKADGRPKLGGEAKRSKEGQDFEYSMEVTSAIAELVGA